MKKHACLVISLILLVGILTANLATAQTVVPRYIGATDLYSSLDISSTGAARCDGEVDLRSGYTADLTVELQRDGVTIKTWRSSGNGDVTAGGTYYVESGHDYVVVATATVYNSSGQWIESPVRYSAEQHY